MRVARIAAINKLVTLGRLGKTHGVLGWLRLISFTEPTENILTYVPWFINIGKDWQPVSEYQTKQQGSRLYIKFSGYDSPEKAKQLTNATIAVLRSQLPPLPAGEFYWADLAGLRVINEQNIELGIIDHLFATGSNDVLVVKNAQQECLIPYLKQVVLAIDLDAGVMRVAWQEDEA